MTNFDKVPQSYPDNNEWLRLIADVVNNIVDGKINATGSFTLTAGATSTVVSDRRCGTGSVVLITPTTANAAGAVATTYIPSTTVKNQFTVTHANTGTTDRTFNYAILG